MQCPARCGKHCKNQPIWQPPRYDLVTEAYYPQLGTGLVATQDIENGIFLMEYVGTLVASEDFMKIDGAPGKYGMYYDEGRMLVIDAYKKENMCK